MHGYQYATMASTALLGPAVLVSYAQLRDGGSYLSSKYWLGLPRGLVTATVVAQCAAAVGFIAFLVTMTRRPPGRGVLRRWGLPVTVTVFLFASLLWATCVSQALKHRSRVLGVATSVCLVVAAVATIVMLAGVFESDMTGADAVVALVGITLLCTVVVLLDGVGWNARWIHRRPWATS